MLANVNTQFWGNGTKLFSILKNGRMVSSPTMTRITMKLELMVTNTGPYGVDNIRTSTEAL